MCVILIAEQTRMTPEVCEAAFEANDHGAGIAWREKGKIRWEKGLQIDGIKKLVASVPMPYVAHFRINSCGGRVPELTHPFPISAEVETLLSGEFDGAVMAHNGHYGKWTDAAVDIALRTGKPIPPGHWNDTRVMAWMAHIYGEGILDFTRETIAVIDKDDIRLYGERWVRHSDTDLLCSNLSWEHRWKGIKRSYSFRDGRRNVGASAAASAGASDDQEDHTSAKPKPMTIGATDYSAESAELVKKNHRSLTAPTSLPSGTSSTDSPESSGTKDGSGSPEKESSAKASGAGAESVPSEVTDSPAERVSRRLLAQVPFRRDEGSTKEGKDQPGSVAGGEEGAQGRGSSGTIGTSHISVGSANDPLSPSSALKLHAWVRSLNPSKFKTSTSARNAEPMTSTVFNTGKCSHCGNRLIQDLHTVNIWTCTNKVCGLSYVEPRGESESRPLMD